MQKLLGVVLCGGQSKRMGTDKGLLIHHEKPWAVLVADTLKNAGLSLAVSINKTQTTAYQAIFKSTPLVTDHLSIDGPLGGLLSVHTTYPDQDILLLACDMIDVDIKTLEYLIKAYHENPQYEYFVYRDNSFTQPFCAIYTAKALAGVFKAYQKKELKTYSLHKRFDSANTYYLPVTNSESFNNYNRL
jgi:molybdenum cofactor guanylyltransferase